MTANPDLKLIGSAALQHWAGIYGFEMPRKPVDTDLLGTFEAIRAFLLELKPGSVKELGENHLAAFKNGTIYDFEIAWPGSSGADLLEMYAGEEFLPFEVLFCLKHSHRYKKDSPHFAKTMADWRLLRTLCLKYGAKWDNRLISWLKKREKETYTNVLPKLNVSKKDFFNESGNLKYVYDHDTLHLAVKHLERPAYEYFKDDQAQVFCSRSKFEACDKRIKLYSALEETYVLALERSQIPFPGTNPKWSFDMAASKICSSISGGWWREFIYETYPEWVAMYDPGYVDRFRTGLAAGIVKPFTKASY